MTPSLAARAMTLFRGTAPLSTEKGTTSTSDATSSSRRVDDGFNDSSWRSGTRTSFASSSHASSTLLVPSDDATMDASSDPKPQDPANISPVESPDVGEHQSSRPGLLNGHRRELTNSGGGSSGRGGGFVGSIATAPRRPSRLSLSLRRLSSISHLRRPSATVVGGGGGGDPASSGRDGETEEEEGKIDQMMELLTNEQVEVAARASYKYYCASTSSTTNSRDVDADTETVENSSPALKGDDVKDLQRRYARDMARRYLRSNRHHDPRAAANKLVATLTFRQEMDVDGLRTAFHDPASPHRTPLLQRLGDRAAYVCGFDVDGRATFVFEPHRVNGHDEHWTMRQHVYTLERAVACSRAVDGTVNAVVNFRGFSYARHAPPTHIGQQFFTTLRSHYAGHVHQIFIVDAPGAFYCLWTLLKPFIGRTTRSKIQFVNSEAQKKAVIGRYYHPHQARPWMLPHGEKSRELDLDEYLFRTPFDKAFDDAYP